jgi:amidase
VDLNFGSALDIGAAIAARKISSVEVTGHVFDRIDRYQPKLNAFVYQMRDEALSAARRADELIAHGGKTSPITGVPVVVKESFGIAGRPCTWGIPALKGSRAPANSTPVHRLIDAGAVIVGATNVPINLMDCQSYNEIYGTTNNPWDLSRTPGGSSGGTAAALAAGLGFLGIGSDIGGSIRAPAHCCGIFGHKPTLDVVPMTGHAPGGVRGSPGFSTLLAVGGPLARTAEDLEAGLRILAGPEQPDSVAYNWHLPAPRHQSLRDFRIGYILEDPMLPISSEVKPCVESSVRTLDKAGAKLASGWPQGFSLGDFTETYLFMFASFTYSVSTPEEQAAQRAQFAGAENDPYAAGALSDVGTWQVRNLKRLAFRAAWQRYFGTVDAFVLPALPVPAFPHDHSEQPGLPVFPMKRTLATPEGPLPYMPALLGYMGLAILTGCPATVAPAGKTKTGLPVGVQILGPYLEDATPIRLAALIEKEHGGFTPPPSY